MPTNERVVLITGASRGLGLEVARCFARRQARLILTARDDAALQVAVAELRQQTDLAAMAGDVAEADQCEALVALGLARFGRIDVLINNASTLGPSPMPVLDAYPVDDLPAVFQVNAIAPLRLAQLVLPGMRQRGSGVIINVTSDAGVNAYPGWGAYGASKAALEHLSRTLAAEVEGSGVRVYVVDPGDMNTRMHEEAEPGVDLGHLPTPDVPAPAFVYLVEEETAPYLRVEASALVNRSAAR